MRSLLAKPAGVLPPTTAPRYKTHRSPLWAPNQRGGGAVPLSESDPIAGNDAGQRRIFHYRTSGNAYLRQPWNSALTWSRNNTPANGPIFAFKCLIKPHEIHGRRLIYSAKGSLKSGGIFVDMLDGRPRLGWYDTVQKREVYIESDTPIYEPGAWHYLYVRKRFPDTSLGNGCWTDTIFTSTSSSTNDVLLCRPFPKSNLAQFLRKPWHYKKHAATGVTTTERNFIGMTTDLTQSVGGGGSALQAVGIVSPAGTTYTGTVGGQLIAAAGTIFSPDMLGMYFVAADGALQGTVVVVDTFVDATHVNCVDPTTGLAVDLSGLGGCHGAIYMGAKLVKSDGFDTSENPDQTAYDVELFGSHLAADPESGILPFVGEFASFAYTVTASGANPNIFETAAADHACDGLDAFNNVDIFDGGSQGPDELHVTSDCFTAVDTQVYAGAAPASSVPNPELEVALESVSSAGASPLTWRYVRKPVELDKPRRLRVAFYDPEQATLSNPSPEVIVRAGGDDASSPSGDVKIVVYDLPVSLDKGPIETWVFMSVSDGATLFKVAEVTGRGSSIAISKNDDQIPESGVILDFNNFPPPECGVIEASQDALAFGDLRRAVNDDEGTPKDIRDGVVFSKAFNPVSLPAQNFFQVPSGAGERITMMLDFNGRLLIGKDDLTVKATLGQTAPAYETISPSIGCRAPASALVHDNVAFWIGDRGPYAYTGTGVPEWVGEPMEHFFNYASAPSGHVDRKYVADAVAAINRRRNQYVLVVRQLEEDYSNHRLSIEAAREQGRLRFSRYRTPNLTSVGEFQDPLSGVTRFVGGTVEGFVVWLDREDTRLVMLGPTAAVHGDSVLVATAGATANTVPVSGTIDTDLSGARGALLRWGAGSEAIVLFAEGSTLHLDKPTGSPPPNGTALTLGLRTVYWETHWIDFEIAEQDKTLRYIDLIYTVGVGLVTLTIFQDFDPTGTVLSFTLDTSGPGYQRFDVSQFSGRFFKLRVESTAAFELVQIVFRHSYTDAF